MKKPELELEFTPGDAPNHLLMINGVRHTMEDVKPIYEVMVGALLHTYRINNKATAPTAQEHKEWFDNLKQALLKAGCNETD